MLLNTYVHVRNKRGVPNRGSLGFSRRVFVGRRGRAVVRWDWMHLAVFSLRARIFPLVTGLSICHLANAEFVRRAPPKLIDPSTLTSSLPNSNCYASDILIGESVNGCSLVSNMEGTTSTPSASALPNVNGTPNESQRTSTSNFAFLIHSQDSLNRNLPPKVDNKKAVRQAQRRRRTR